MKRRALLAALGASTLGVAGTAAGRSAQATDDQRDCETVEIPVAKSGNQTIATREVPAEWWDHVERSRTVSDEIGEEFGDEAWFQGSGRSSDGETICGSSKMVLTVYARDVDAAEAALPERRDGVRIRVEPERDVSLAGPAELDDADVSENTTPDHGSAQNDTADDGAADEAAEPEADGAPGFGVLGALLGAGGAAALARLRRNDE